MSEAGGRVGSGRVGLGWVGSGWVRLGFGFWLRLWFWRGLERWCRLRWGWVQWFRLDGWDLRDVGVTMGSCAVARRQLAAAPGTTRTRWLRSPYLRFGSTPATARLPHEHAAPLSASAAILHQLHQLHQAEQAEQAAKRCPIELAGVCRSRCRSVVIAYHPLT